MVMWKVICSGFWDAVKETLRGIEMTFQFLSSPFLHLSHYCSVAVPAFTQHFPAFKLSWKFRVGLIEKKKQRRTKRRKRRKAC